MNEDRDPLYEEDEILEIVRRFEDMKKNKTQRFFDVYEFENIIDYYIETNKSGKAFEAASLASRQHPTSITIQMKRAQVLVDKGEPLQSLRILEKLEKLESSNYEIFAMKGTALSLMGDIENARKSFDQALSLNPENKEDLIFDITMTFEHLGHYREALRYLKKAFRMNQEDPSILYEMAFCYDKLNELDKSIKFYKSYLETDPYADNIWYNLGIVYNKNGDFTKAVDAYDFAIAINDQNAFAHFNKGNILANLEKYKEAIAAYKEYLEIDEKSCEALTYVAECYESLGDISHAIEFFRKAVDTDRDFPEPWYGLGKMLIKKNLHSDSIYYLKKAIELDKEEPDYWVALALAQKITGEYKEAELAYFEAIKLDPFDYRVWIELADLMVQNGKYAEALAVLRKAEENIHENAIITYRISACYFLLSDESLALDYFSRGMETNHHKHVELYKWYPEGRTDKKVRQIIKEFKNKHS